MLSVLPATIECDFEDVDQCGYFHDIENSKSRGLWKRDYKSSSTSDHGEDRIN